MYNYIHTPCHHPTQDYLTTLEQNINGLVSHLEQSVRRKASAERTGHWFRAISESEPDDTYLKTAAADLSRTCEATEGQQTDSDETLFIHNLQSVADFVRASQVSLGVREGGWMEGLV